MTGCIEQKYGNSPLSGKLTEYVAFVSSTWEGAKRLFVLWILCGTSSRLRQVSFEPAAMVTIFGLKAKLSMLTSFAPAAPATAAAAGACALAAASPAANAASGASASAAAQSERQAAGMDAYRSCCFKAGIRP